ncbi:MAG: hypothetical protein QM704_01045 [Anaeromyxobacteraceae bacterium]
MKMQIRMLLAAAVLVLAAGYLGLRSGNAALERKVAATARGEVTP